MQKTDYKELNPTNFSANTALFRLRLLLRLPFRVRLRLLLRLPFRVRLRLLLGYRFGYGYGYGWGKGAKPSRRCLPAAQARR